MEPISTAKARDQLADIVNRAAYGGERVILSRRGKPLVAVVPIEDVELLQELEDEYDRRAIDAAHEEIDRDGTIPWEQVKRELGL